MLHRLFTTAALAALLAASLAARGADAPTPTPTVPSPLPAAAPTAAAATPARPVPPPFTASPAAGLPGALAAPGAAAPGAAPMAAGAASAPAAAASDAAAGAMAVPTTLDSRVQDVKSDVIKLNRDLLVLEEELLFPANTQVAFFVSMDTGNLFQLDSVQIKVDDKVVANYLYTALEVEALQRGGVQRVYLGNLRTGNHELVATFTGKGPHERDYKRGATVKFDKTTEAKYIELRISDSAGKLQPEFDVKLWQ